MSCMGLRGWVFAVGLFAGLWTTPAVADGGLLGPTGLRAGSRASLAAAIGQARKANPEAFVRIARVREVAERAAGSQHGRLPTITPALKSLGKPALFPMIEMMAFDAPARGALSDRAWLALRVGSIEAVGAQREPMSEGVLAAILQTPSTEPEVVRAAAKALGRLGTDTAAATLTEMSSVPGTKQMSVIEGMGTVVAMRLHST